MKYNININQLALAGTNLDYVDAAVVDYIFNFNKFSYQQILEEVPLLRIRSKGALSARLKKIERAGVLKISRQATVFSVRLTPFGEQIKKKWKIDQRRHNPSEDLSDKGIIIGKCLVCKNKSVPLAPHHSVPRSLGGKTTTRVCLNCHYLHHYNG